MCVNAGSKAAVYYTIGWNQIIVLQQHGVENQGNQNQRRLSNQTRGNIILQVLTSQFSSRLVGS